MKTGLKTLLLSSAAALSFGQALAADAIVVEPEPMEYVKVCDMYGAGFFYIPGTETCLKLYGDVRVDYSAMHYHADFLNGVSTHDVTVRGRIGFTAQNETEYGTLGSNILFAGTASDGSSPHDVFSAVDGQDGSMWLSVATINLAGFRTGYDDDGGAAWNRYGGYGYYNARFDGLYGFHTAIFFEYGQSAGDFSWVVGIQDTPSSGAAGQPDPYAAMTYSAGGLSIAAAAIYDSSAGNTAFRVRGDYDLSSVMPGLSVGGWYEADHGKTDYVKGHKWGVTASAQLMEKITLFGGYSEYDGQGVAALADTKNWTVGLTWAVVEGLTIQPEYSATWFANQNKVNQNNGVMSLRIVRSF